MTRDEAKAVVVALLNRYEYRVELRRMDGEPFVGKFFAKSVVAN